MKSPRKGFGHEKTLEMCEILDFLANNHDFNNQYEAYLDAIEILKKYVENKEKYQLDTSHIDFNRWPIDVDRCNGRLSSMSSIIVEGNDFRSFAFNRHSVRSFDSSFSIDNDVFIQAVDLARTAPSACNRQSCRVSLVDDEELAKKILDIQNGNKGFSNAKACVLVMVDLNCYRYTGEMNTAFVDGGIFLMNLIYSLEYYGINSCPLIWDDYGFRREALDKIINIEHNLLIVGVLAVGKADPLIKYLESPRNDSRTIIKSFDTKIV